MNRPDFQDLADLWRDQVDPGAEEASLRELATDIQRSAVRRRRIDFSLGIFALAVVAYYAANNPIYWWVYLIGAAVAAAGLGVRHHLHKAARALVFCDPEKFCEAALRNVRLEQRVSAIGLWGIAPTIVVLMLLLRVAETGDLAQAVDRLFGEYLVRLLAAVGTGLGIVILFLGDNRRLRDHIRQLEALDRERKVEEARDLTEEA